MQNTLAAKQQSSGKGKIDGQTNRNENASLFWFPVYEGLFEHAPTMSDAVWLFMWLIARTTREENGSGNVLGGIPINDGLPAGELGYPLKTIRRWRRMLVKDGYISTVRTPYGFKYKLLKSKKWQKQALRDRPKLPISPERNAQIAHSDLPPRVVGMPNSGTKSSRSGKNKEDNTGDNTGEAEDATAAPTGLHTVKGKTSEICEEAWADIGIEPCGTVRFCETWERIYGDSTESELLSVVMERAIQHCQTNGIRVPPPFYAAKRKAEEKESNAESDDVARVARHVGVDPVRWAHLLNPEAQQ
jgi:hypothetical protein